MHHCKITHLQLLLPHKLPGIGMPLNLTLSTCSLASCGVKETLNFACPKYDTQLKFANIDKQQGNGSVAPPYSM